MAATLVAGAAGPAPPPGGPPQPIEIPLPGAVGKAFVILYSGDGGWADSDRRFSRALTRLGLPVVGVDSLHYFWRTRRKVDEAADLAALIETYRARWNRPEVIVVGFSFGAAQLPSILAQMTPRQRQPVKGLILMAPTDYADSALRPQSWLNIKGPHAAPIAPSLAELRGLPVLCLYGRTDRAAACPRLASDLAQVRVLPGGHQFKGDEDAVAAIVASLASSAAAGP